MKPLPHFTLYFFLLVFALFGVYKIYTSNSKSLYLSDCKNSDAVVIRRLNEIVEQNFLNRESYEVFAYSDEGPCSIILYNTRYKALWICVDPGNGWAYMFDVTPAKLRLVVEKGYTYDQLQKILKPLLKYKEASYPG